MRPEELSRAIRNENRLGRAGDPRANHPIKTGRVTKAVTTYPRTKDQGLARKVLDPLGAAIEHGYRKFIREPVTSLDVSFRGQRFPKRNIVPLGGVVPKKNERVAVAFTTKNQGFMLGKISSGHTRKHAPGSIYYK